MALYGSEGRGTREHQSATTAAAVVGALVLIAPAVLLLLGAAVFAPPSAIGPQGSSMEVLLQVELAVLPFALVAAWRTWVHARRWIRTGRASWISVVEAAGCGLAIAIGSMWRGLVERPLEAPPYVIVYGGAALLLGAVVGFILRAVALAVLKRSVRAE